MARLLASIGSFSARHGWFAAVAWAVLLVLALGGAAVFSKPLNGSVSIPGVQSISTLNRISHEFGGGVSNSGNIVFAAPKGQKLTPADAVAVGQLASRLQHVPGVVSATDPFTAQLKTVSPDGRVGYLTVITSGTPGTQTQNGITQAVDHAQSNRLEVQISSALVQPQSTSTTPIIGIILAFLILVIAFRTLLASSLPLATALLGLGTSLGAIYAATHLTSVYVSAPALAVLLALSVGIDYSVFIVSRHRQQLLQGMECPPIDRARDGHRRHRGLLQRTDGDHRARQTFRGRHQRHHPDGHSRRRRRGDRHAPRADADSRTAGDLRSSPTKYSPQQLLSRKLAARIGLDSSRVRVCLGRAPTRSP